MLLVGICVGGDGFMVVMNQKGNDLYYQSPSPANEYDIQQAIGVILHLQKVHDTNAFAGIVFDNNNVDKILLWRKQLDEMGIGSFILSRKRAQQFECSIAGAERACKLLVEKFECLRHLSISQTI